MFGAAGASSGIRCQIFSVGLIVPLKGMVTDKRGGVRGVPRCGGSRQGTTVDMFVEKALLPFTSNLALI